jgi:hypothetical protein
MVNPKDNSELKKLYAGKDKVRFEVETGNAGTGPAAVILDETQNQRYRGRVGAAHVHGGADDAG